MRIITATYGDLVAPPHKDLLYKYLLHRSIDGRVQLGRMKATLTSRITLQVPNRIARHLQVHGAEAGYYIYKVHLRQMCIFTMAQNHAGVPAMTSIRTFMALYGIEEDDLAIDTAYKIWQRYQEFNNKLFKRTLQKQIHNCTVLHARMPPRGDELWNEIAEFSQTNFQSFLFKSGRINFHFLRKVIIYYLYRHAGYSVEEISRTNGLSTRVIYKHIDYIRERLTQSQLTA